MNDNIYLERKDWFSMEIGTVCNVDAVNRTVSVDMLDGSVLNDIQIASPLLDSELGSGIMFIPRLGSTCIVSKAGGNYFVAGFISVGRSYENPTGGITDDINVPPGFSIKNSINWFPGDCGIVSSGNNESYIKVSAAGTIIISSSPLCSIMLRPEFGEGVSITTDSIKWNMGSNIFTVTTDRDKPESKINLRMRTPDQDKTETIDLEILSNKDGGSVSMTMSSGTTTIYGSKGDFIMDAVEAISISSSKNISLNNSNLIIKP